MNESLHTLFQNYTLEIDSTNLEIPMPTEFAALLRSLVRIKALKEKNWLLEFWYLGRVKRRGKSQPLYTSEVKVWVFLLVKNAWLKKKYTDHIVKEEERSTNYSPVTCCRNKIYIIDYPYLLVYLVFLSPSFSISVLCISLPGWSLKMIEVNAIRFTLSSNTFCWHSCLH